jgi:ribose/xylose/arabinose/galactoside ABC-type transport system permease subunit
MTGLQAIGVVIIRLWAATSVFSGASALASLGVMSVPPSGDRTYFTYSLFDGSMWLAAGIFAWLFARRLAHVITPPSAPSELTISIGADQFAALVSFLIGAFFVVERLPPFIARMATMFLAAARSSPYGTQATAPSDPAEIISELALLLLALLLMLRPRDVARRFMSSSGAQSRSVE